MTDRPLTRLTTDQLVIKFMTLALQQHDALERDEVLEYNQLFKEIEAVKSELMSRDGDERRKLLPLLSHQNPQVRLKAANALLALVPAEARAALQKICDDKEDPQCLYAGSMLGALDDGIYSPV